MESLPSEPLDTEEVKPLNSRYDAQISVFGSKLQKKLKEAKVLIVGSGAKGCEFLKNSALMGLCCGDGGKLSITDDGVVARSNLSRYFMFREEDIGEAKSEVGVSAASSMNREFMVKLCITVLALRVEVCQMKRYGKILISSSML